MEAKRKAVDPLEPGRHRCARVEMCSNHSRDRGSAMNVTTYGLDVAKRVFQVHWIEPETGEVKRKTLARNEVSAFLCPSGARCRGDGSLRLGAPLGPNAKAHVDVYEAPCARPTEGDFVGTGVRPRCRRSHKQLRARPVNSLPSRRGRRARPGHGGGHARPLRAPDAATLRHRGVDPR